MVQEAFVSAIIVAAGKSTRMGSNKMLQSFGSKTVFERTVAEFEDCGAVNEMIVVSSEENVEEFSELVRKNLFSKVTAIVHGGANRQESVFNGLKYCGKNADAIVIHDGARPLVKKETVAKVLSEALVYGAASAAIKSRDTIKRIDGEGFAVDTIDRETAVLIQTPQAFRRDIIMEAHEKAAADGFLGTDDCSLTERMGIKTKLIYVPYYNLKLTVPEDILLAKAVLTVRGAL